MSKQKKKGFTLIELLAVIVVLAIILVIAVPKILEVIENARLKAYEDSVNLMIKQAHLDYGSKNVTGSKIEYPVSYEYGIDSDGETIQTNEKEVGLLNFKGDKPSEGTIVVDELGKVTVQNLVSKDRKFCAIKGAGEKNATVGRATELNCIEEDEKPIPDKVACELEKDKDTYYVDSVCDLYALSYEVNNGNTYEGKKIEIRNDLDMGKIDEDTKKYINKHSDYFTEDNNKKINERFAPIGNKDHPFSGKVDGNIKYIKNLTIDKTGIDNVGIFGYVTTKANFVGLNLENIMVKGNNSVGGLIGEGTTKTQINEVVAKNIDIVGTGINVGGISGHYGSITNVIIKSGKVKGDYQVHGIEGYDGSNTIVKNSIVENLEITARATYYGPISHYSSNSYYSNKVTINGKEQTNGLSENATSNINMYEYAGLDTYVGGDNDSSGYYFDYENDNSNNIVLKSVKKDPITFTLAGEGTKENPYLIRNMKEWKMVAGRPNREVYYKISNDIDLSSGHFYMIGSAGNPFSGKVDGNLSRLSNLNVDIAPADNVGIFGYVTSTASFVGLNIENITVKGKNSVGGLIGEGTTKTQINEVVAKNIDIVGTGINVGGISGHYGSITNVIIKSGKVKGDYQVHGIEGYDGSNTIVKNSIVENLEITARATYYGPISHYSSNSYYSNKVTINGNVQTNGFDSEYIDDLDYYTNKVETRLNGDKNNTGYYFDYVYSKGGIYLVNKYDKQESDDDTPNDQKTCKVTYGTEQRGCYRYTSGTHDGYKYRSPSSGVLEDGNGAACTGTGLSAAFRKKVYYSCN